MAIPSDSLRGYGHAVHLRNNFVCAYCGYDGRSFPNWLQLTVDHVLPTSSGGDDSPENKVTACQACNSITSRMEFASSTTIDAAFNEKCARVRLRRKEYFSFWIENVAMSFVTNEPTNA
jgi:5-methylcytosine-specific restriction endonuclease McrA